MSVEAWVKPTSLGSWNTVVFKERPGYYAYALYANTGTNRPSANIFTSGDNDIRGTAQLPVNAWSHVAMTYDGNMLTLYVNGVQAAQLLAPGATVTSTGLLKIGGNAIWGEYFAGLIDEVHDLQPDADRGADQRRHDAPGDEPRYDAADGPRHADGDGLADVGAAQLDSGNG